MRDLDIPLPVMRAVLGPMFRVMMDHRLPVTARRKLSELASLAQPVPADTAVTPLRLGGRPAERLTAPKTATPRPETAVLYLHGGGYTIGSPTTHRSLAARLAHETGASVYQLDYRLAPEHPHPAALEDALAAFDALVGLGHRQDRIAIAGDSAGGGLSLATAQHLVTERGVRPAALGLIAPWGDPNLPPPGERDLVVNRRWSRRCARDYLGDGDPASTGYAPLRGPMAGLPPTYVQADTGELLHGQCVELVAALREAGVPVRFHETSGLWHVAQLQASLTARAAAAVSELSAFLMASLQPATAPDLG
ncbi:alpha/beta hydrolase [Nocardia farcinica]|uniref:alpha/beta hydrolase n=1 Tax=Nocardia farcinica TaxID=37329 RepID=UPI0024587A89|nr:alpha/beta hydrolase [Nocardia farcinica]